MATPAAEQPSSRNTDAPRRLDSWKAISDHLGRHVTTVQRWEREEGLPVFRHLHDKRSSVYALTDELDAWLDGRSRLRAEPDTLPPDSPPAPVAHAPGTTDAVLIASSTSGLWGTALMGAAIVAVIAIAPAPREPQPSSAPVPLVAAATPLAASEALAEYQRGRYLWDRRRKSAFALAQKYYARAIARDAQLSAAYVGLADTYILGSGYWGLAASERTRQGTWLATKALEVNPTSGEAMASLAKLRMDAWDWEPAEAGFREAIQHTPNYPPAHYWYAAMLAYQRRCKEAHERIGIAEQLAPIALSVQHVAVIVDLACGDLADAKRRLAVMRDLDPAFPWTYNKIGRISLLEGNVKAAVTSFEQGMTLLDGSATGRAELAFAYARAGQTADATRLADTLRQEYATTADEVSEWALALVAVGFHQSADALTWLERAYDAQEPAMRTLAIDERFASLRGESRFHRLLRLLRLPDPAPPSAQAVHRPIE